MTQVFISYQNKYREFATRVRDQLRAWGYGTWLDADDIPKGAYFRREIDRGLRNSDVIIAVLTQEALDSREVQFEWDYAISQNKTLLPLKYRECELLYHLVSIQYIDFLQDEARAFEDLRHALPPLPASQPASPPQFTAPPIAADVQVPEPPPPAEKPQPEAPATPPPPVAQPQPAVQSPLRHAPDRPRVSTVNRGLMLQKVNDFWIKGVLEQ